MYFEICQVAISGQQILRFRVIKHIIFIENSLAQVKLLLLVVANVGPVLGLAHVVDIIDYIISLPDFKDISLLRETCFTEKSVVYLGRYSRSA